MMREGEVQIGNSGLKGHRQKVDVQALVTEVVVTPQASTTILSEIDQLVKSKGYVIPVEASTLTRFRELLPNSESLGGRRDCA